mmetsp:Transcript_13725/g.33232  ORF Transcript_13725/g.33232 Transcript_13725/m.33232 type:complete len:128 (-) Transcript_13725:75-458(-)
MGKDGWIDSTANNCHQQQRQVDETVLNQQSKWLQYLPQNQRLKFLFLAASSSAVGGGGRSLRESARVEDSKGEAGPFRYCWIPSCMEEVEESVETAGFCCKVATLISMAAGGTKAETAAKTTAKRRS